MHIDRLALLARLGELLFIEEPSGEGGGDAPKDDDSKDGASGAAPKDDAPKDDDSPKTDDDSDDEGGFKPITSKEEFDRILGKRLHRERSKYADYDDLKTKVSDLEAANAKLSEDLSKESRKSILARISAETGIPEEDLTGASEQEIRASAERINARVEALVSARMEAAGVKGRSPHTGTGSERPPVPTTESGRERARASSK